MAEENHKNFNAPMDPTKQFVVYTFVAGADKPITIANMGHT